MRGLTGDEGPDAKPDDHRVVWEVDEVGVGMDMAITISVQ